MHSVLLVEDDQKISLAVTLRLRSMGYEVDSAYDAVYAMNAAMQVQPEVVLLDINLPGGDGFMVADKMRSSDQLSSTPIVFISASKDPRLKQQAASYSDSLFVEKPFQATELTQAIDALCH